MANKYLLIDDKIVFSTGVEMHCNMVTPEMSQSKIRGGGRWGTFGDKPNRIYLYDTSAQYGAAEFNDIVKAIGNSELPGYLKGSEIYFSTDYIALRIITGGKFVAKIPE